MTKIAVSNSRLSIWTLKNQCRAQSPLLGKPQEMDAGWWFSPKHGFPVIRRLSGA